MVIGKSLRNIIRCVIVLLAGNVFAGEITQELQAEINRLGPTDEVAVIIRFRDAVDLGAFNEQDIRLRRESMIRALRNKTNAATIVASPSARPCSANKDFSTFMAPPPGVRVVTITRSLRSGVSLRYAIQQQLDQRRSSARAESAQPRSS